MAVSTLASPLCTWLVAACMSAVCQTEQQPSMRAPSAFSPLERLSRTARRKRQKCSQRPVSVLGGSTIHGLMSSCLAFGPCEEYYRSASVPFFGENGLLSFGSKVGSSCRQRRMGHRAVAVKAVNVAVEPAKESPGKKRPVTKKRRVVVTGVGAVTPLGHEPNVFYSNLLEGVSGISEIEGFDCAEFPTRIAGEIKSFSSDGWVAPKLSKRMDKFMLYLLTAGKKALADGGITDELMNEFDKTKCGVLIGSAMGGLKVFSDAIEALRISYKKMNPFCIPFSTTNMGSAILAMDLGWMGPNYSISTACATSNFCILNAAEHIIRGEAVNIGSGFVACKALSQRNDDPTKASRPWDTHRDGFVMGEGAGVLLLEELEHAKKRGAEIYAEFLGGSFSCDAYHMTEPHPEGTGVVLCINKALAESGVAREDVNYVNAHATSTPAGDVKEYQALVHCFGENPELRINSTKSMIGHLLGGSGAVEAVATIQAPGMPTHPNAARETRHEYRFCDCPLLRITCLIYRVSWLQYHDTKFLVGPKKERLDIKAALSNSFGFGGHNSSILFGPYK
ncbi:Protein TRANSPORT INHIBITOR RESPONSE 1 [Asimina triloba]